MSVPPAAARSSCAASAGQCGSVVIRSSTASHSAAHFCAGVSLTVGVWPPGGCASMGLASARLTWLIAATRLVPKGDSTVTWCGLG